MDWMRFPLLPRANARAGLVLDALIAALLLAALFSSGCKHLRQTDMRPLDQAGMWFRSVEELRRLRVTDAEVAELVKVRQAGVSDDACVRSEERRVGKECRS